MKVNLELKDQDKREEIEKGILVPTSINLVLYKVRYMYKTKRGRQRESYYKVIAEDEEDARFKAIEFLNNFNKKYPYRTLSNVNILGSKPVAQYKVQISA